MDNGTLKRDNLVVLDDRLKAWDIMDFLKAKGIDAKVVSKHAVQIHPNQIDAAKELSKSYHWGWRRAGH